MLAKLLKWLSLRPNLTGAIIATTFALAIFGDRLESTFFPIISETEVSDVYVEDGRIHWTLTFEKYREARLDSAGFVFTYRNGTVSVPLTPFNETKQVAIGLSPLPPGQFRISYSATLPEGARAGDWIDGVVWYNTNIFWRVHHNFGHVTVPC